MPEFLKAKLEELITHEELLEKCAWLTPQMIGRWRREGLIRYVRGRKGVYVYPKSDIDGAINADLKCGEQVDPAFGDSNEQEPARPMRQTSVEADELSAKLSREQIFKPKRKAR